MANVLTTTGTLDVLHQMETTPSKCQSTHQGWCTNAKQRHQKTQQIEPDLPKLRRQFVPEERADQNNSWESPALTTSSQG